ncbi:MAG: ankyrin repeat protein [Rickettsiales bacterium]|jgi:ankyrin repeat protein
MKKEKITVDFETLVEDLLLTEKIQTITHQELMGKFQLALANEEIGAESPLKTNFDFWKNKALNPNQDEEEGLAQTQVKSTLDNILSTYFVGDEYKDYAKYLDENCQELDDQKPPKTKQYLYRYVMEMAEVGDAELPRLMYVMISFFDRVSKLPLAEQKKLLAQFPIPDADEYNCIGGTQTRLSQVSLQMENYLIQSCENAVSGVSSNLLRFVDQNIESHLPSCLQKSLGLQPQDGGWVYVPPQISAKDTWEFIKSFNESVAKSIEAQLNPQREAIKKIAEVFDDTLKCTSFTDPIWKQFEDALVPHFVMLGIADKASLSTYLERENLITRIGDIDPDPREFYFNSQVIEKKLIGLAQESNLKIESQNEEIFDFNLHDLDAPTRISAILKSQQSTPYQKHLATTALWILSQNFAGNSPDNFFKTLYALGENGTVDERLDRAIEFLSSAQVQGNELSNNLTQEIIGRIQSNKTKYPFYQKIFNNSLSFREYVKLGVPQDFLEKFDENAQLADEDRVAFSGFWRALLNQRSRDEQGNIYEDWAQIIFYHPSRDKIIQLAKAKQNELTEKQVRNLINVEGHLLEVALPKQDISFLRTLLEIEIVAGRKIRNAFNLIKYSFQTKNKPMQNLVIEVLGGINQAHSNQTLLSIAIERNDLKMAEFLIENGADILSPIEGERTVLSFAATKKDVSSVHFLLQKLFDGILMQDTEKLKNIKNNIISVRDGIAIIGEEGNAAEILQILNESSNIFPALLALKENQNSPELKLESKLAILNFSAQNNYLNLAKSVSDFDQQSNNPQIQKEHIQNAFFLAIEHNNQNVFNYFLTQNVNINEQNQDGDSPLMIACKRSSLSNIAISLLLNPKINLVAINNAGENFLHIALNNIDFMLESVFEHLIQVPQETFTILINKQDNSGNTTLHDAIGKDVEMQILEKLLTEENCNLVNTAGETPFMLAVKNNKFDFAKIVFDGLGSVDQIIALNTALLRDDPVLSLGVLSFINRGNLPRPAPEHPQAAQLAQNQQDEEIIGTPPSSPTARAARAARADAPPPINPKGARDRNIAAQNAAPINLGEIVNKVRASYPNTPNTAALITNITKAQNANPRNAGQE